MGWFIEGILPLAPFAKKPVSLVFENCITNDDFDMSVDTLKEVRVPSYRQLSQTAVLTVCMWNTQVTFPLLQRFGNRCEPKLCPLKTEVPALLPFDQELAQTTTPG